jgi:biotin operon repressor
MHAGKLETSERLKLTLAALQGGELSTREIAARTFSVAVHSDLAALKANGVEITKRQSGKLFFYRLTAPDETPTII